MTQAYSSVFSNAMTCLIHFAVRALVNVKSLLGEVIIPQLKHIDVSTINLLTNY